MGFRIVVRKGGKKIAPPQMRALGVVLGVVYGTEGEAMAAMIAAPGVGQATIAKVDIVSETPAKDTVESERLCSVVDKAPTTTTATACEDPIRDPWISDELQEFIEGIGEDDAEVSSLLMEARWEWVRGETRFLSSYAHGGDVEDGAWAYLKRTYTRLAEKYGEEFNKLLDMWNFLNSNKDEPVVEEAESIQVVEPCVDSDEDVAYRQQRQRPEGCVSRAAHAAGGLEAVRVLAASRPEAVR